MPDNDDDISIGQFVLKQNELRTQITTKLGTFSFKNLTPVQKSVAEGMIVTRLRDASLNSTEPYIAELTKACVYKESSQTDTPPGWPGFDSFPGESFTMELWKKYQRSLISV